MHESGATWSPSPRPHRGRQGERPGKGPAGKRSPARGPRGTTRPAWRTPTDSGTEPAEGHLPPREIPRAAGDTQAPPQRSGTRDRARTGVVPAKIIPGARDGFDGLRPAAEVIASAFPRATRFARWCKVADRERARSHRGDPRGQLANTQAVGDLPRSPQHPACASAARGRGDGRRDTANATLGRHQGCPRRRSGVWGDALDEPSAQVAPPQPVATCRRQPRPCGSDRRSACLCPARAGEGRALQGSTGARRDIRAGGRGR